MTACNSGDGATGDRADQDNGVVLIPPYSGPPPVETSSTTPVGSGDEAEEVELTGTLVSPTPGCLVLESDNGPWELTLPEELDFRDEVEVVGRIALQEEGHCNAPVVQVIRIVMRGPYLR